METGGTSIISIRVFVRGKPIWGTYSISMQAGPFLLVSRPSSPAIVILKLVRTKPESVLLKERVQGTTFPLHTNSSLIKLNSVLFLSTASAKRPRLSA